MTRDRHTLERHIGERIRRRRAECGLTQQQLAQAIETSYQQLQKYENGSNRISAEKLYRLGRRLGVPTNYFLDGFEEGEAAEEPGHTARERALIELVRSFGEVRAPRVRVAVAALVKAVAERQG